jgi:hypothetical protein
MPINLESKLETVSLSPSYIDLRHLHDDKTVLENPHKGWYYHYVDNSIESPSYRDGVKPDTPFKTKGMHHMYIRFDWGDIEGEVEGMLDWSRIDKMMNDLGKFGYRFTFRVCTFESAFKYATPKWVFDAGARCIELSAFDNGNQEFVGDRYEPDYGDPIYLEKLQNFLYRCAEKFDNDPRVEYIDIGTFGTWGEGHTYLGSGQVYSPEVVKKHIDIHLKAFKNKPLILNDDYIEHVWKTSPEKASELYDYCLNKGLGMRDDSICVEGYVKMFGYNTMRFPSFFAEFAKNAPVDIEFAHISHQNQDPERFKEGLPMIEALRIAHATYAGFHGYEDDWLTRNPYLSDYIANRLGYWLFVDGIDLGTPSSGAREIAHVFVRNKGYSRCYHQYDLKIRLVSDDGDVYYVNDRYPDSTRWDSETLTEETVRLNFDGVPARDYHLEVGMFDGDTPIKLGFNNECNAQDGYYRVSKITVNSL